MMGKTSITLARIKAGETNHTNGHGCHSKKEAASCYSTSDVKLENIIPRK